MQSQLLSQPLPPPLLLQQLQWTPPLQPPLPLLLLRKPEQQRQLPLLLLVLLLRWQLDSGQSCWPVLCGYLQQQHKVGGIGSLLSGKHGNFSMRFSKQPMCRAGVCTNVCAQAAG